MLPYPNLKRFAHQGLRKLPFSGRLLSGVFLNLSPSLSGLPTVRWIMDPKDLESRLDLLQIEPRALSIRIAICAARARTARTYFLLTVQTGNPRMNASRGMLA